MKRTGDDLESDYGTGTEGKRARTEVSERSPASALPALPWLVAEGATSAGSHAEHAMLFAEVSNGCFFGPIYLLFVIGDEYFFLRMFFLARMEVRVLSARSLRIHCFRRESIRNYLIGVIISFPGYSITRACHILLYLAQFSNGRGCGTNCLNTDGKRI